jgi:hypothetical protein
MESRWKTEVVIVILVTAVLVLTGCTFLAFEENVYQKDEFPVEKEKEMLFKNPDGEFELWKSEKRSSQP